MEVYDGQTDVFTRYEIYQQLNNEREIACSPDAGHVVKRESWERIDWLLDCLIDLNAMECLVVTELPHGV